MKLNGTFYIIFAAFFFSGSSSVLAATAPEPYPLEYFALREVTNNVTVSPDGKRVAMLKILHRTGNPLLHVYDADDMDKEPFVVDSEPMEIFSYSWASDDHIVMTVRQKVRDMVKRQEDSVYEYRITILDLEEESFESFDADFPVVENVLPRDPDRIIISEQPGLNDDLGPIQEAVRPRAYYELNLRRGTKKLLIRSKLDLGQIIFDGDGSPRGATGFDVNKREYVGYYRDVGEKKWRDTWRASEDDWDIFETTAYGIDEAVPGNTIIKAYNGHDKVGLWSYNNNTSEFEELLYRRSDVDVSGVRFHSNSWKYPDTIVAVRYATDKYYFEYFDEVEKATYRQLEELIPYSHYVSITSRSRDGNSLVARNIGPRDPGTYYLLHKGEFKAVGSHQPLLESESLADVEYFRYKSRDGRPMAMYVTKPHGEPPFPTVVMPHGGPFVHEVVLYDEWAQMLANNGYMVVQPQYRMSLGYGKEHFLGGIENGSQAGRKMQDDKDDAALFLIEEGLADPERMAMYGWSYGGYAALIAASRSPQLYQCVIAGAAVTDYVRAANDGFRRTPDGIARILRDVYEYGAVHPIREVEKVNVPILLIHGSVDSRVLPTQARLYLKELKKHDKKHKWVELEGADHFYVTLFYEHQLELYESMIDFLANDCGSMSQMQASAAQ